MYRLLCFILIFSLLDCSCQSSDAHAAGKPVKVYPTDWSLLQKMQGNWSDRRDPEARLEVRGQRMLWMYDNELMIERRIEVYDKKPRHCSGKAHKDAIGFFIAYQEDEGYCYQILDLDAGAMDYLPLGVLKP